MTANHPKNSCSIGIAGHFAIVDHKSTTKNELCSTSSNKYSYPTIYYYYN